MRAEAEAGTLEKARCLGYLATIALRAVEVAELADRVDALERALKDRKENPSHDDGWPADIGNSNPPSGCIPAAKSSDQGDSIMRLA